MGLLPRQYFAAIVSFTMATRAAGSSSARDLSQQTPKPFFYVPRRQKFFGRGRFVYSDATDPETNGRGASPRGACMDANLCAVRDDHPAGTGGSLDLAAAGSRNLVWDLRCIGAAARGHRTVWRDVVCGVAEYPRVGLRMALGAGASHLLRLVSRVAWR